MGVPPGERQGCAAARMWRAACGALVAPHADDAWAEVVEASPPDGIWHSLRNCIAYQAGVWQNLIAKGIDDVIQPAAFKLAIVLRHTPSDVVTKLLSDLLLLHPQSQDLTSYILALLTDDEAQWSGSESGSSTSHSTSSSLPGPFSPPSPPSPSAPPAQASTPALAPSSDDAPSSDEMANGDDATSSDDTTNGDDVPNGDLPNGHLRNGHVRNGHVPNGDVLNGDITSNSDSAPHADDAPSSDDAQPGDDAASGDNASPAPRPCPSPPAPPGPAPLRDLQLFGDCELAVMAASRIEYDAHAKLVRAEYSKLTQANYVDLRIKVLNQFSQIPKLFHTPEFECFEGAARENIEREICTLREHLLTGRPD